jgi:hypothetical protein
MRTALLAALVGTTAFITAAVAQQQPPVTPGIVPEGTADARAAIAECERLEAYLQETKPANAGVTLEQVQAWQQNAQVEPCRENLRRLTENRGAAPPPPQAAAPAPGQIPGQSASTSALSAQVVVQQAQPNVTVRQPQPEIIVRQPPPTITVQQAQPEIIVRMPPPDVNVAMARPEVQVSIPQPQVQVVPPHAQLRPDIRVEGEQPNVRFERTGEPQIIYQPSEGQPQIRFEQQGQTNTSAAPAVAASPPSDPQLAQAQLNSEQRQGIASTASPGTGPNQTGAIASPGMQAVKASDLERMTLYNGRDEKMGKVENVLMGPDNKAYLLISHGGFLGLGQKQVALAAEQIAMRGDRLVAENLTDEQIRALPEFKESASFREVAGDQTTNLRLVQ